MTVGAFICLLDWTVYILGSQDEEQSIRVFMCMTLHMQIDSLLRGNILEMHLANKTFLLPRSCDIVWRANVSRLLHNEDVDRQGQHESM